VPARALRALTSITLSPIASIEDLPPGASLAGGAHLTPEGQRFDVPVTLEILLANAPSRTAVPFSYAGELLQRHRYPARVAGRSIDFEIVHFSGYAVLSAVLGDALGYFPAPSERGDRALQEMVDAGLVGLEPAARDSARRSALQGWLDDFIKPEVAALAALSAYDLDAFMSGRIGRLANELRIFAVALKFALLEGSADAFVELQNAYQLEAAFAARKAIDLSNAGCSAVPEQAVLLVAPDILAWQQLAQQADATVLDESLGRQQVLQALCVQPVFDPQNPVTFAAEAPGQGAPLTARVGYSINDAPARFDLPMLVSSLGTSNVTPNTLDSVEVGAGQTYARLFRWNATAPSMRIDVSACFGEESLHELCKAQFVVRGAPADSTVEFDFANGLQGWSVGTGSGQLDSGKWIDNIGNPPGAVQLDGSDFGVPDVLPNAWISRSISLSPSATSLAFDTRASDENGALRVRLVAADGTSVTLLDWEVLSGGNWVPRTASLAAFAGQTVTIFFEQGDNDIGVGEHRYIDNVRIVGL
jgi:hypothetical protein